MSYTEGIQFYNHDNYANTFYTSQMVLETFLANQLFKGDLTRIQFASDSWMFRKRLEIVDKKSDNFVAANLDFPFMTYWYQGFWEHDDRVWAKNTAQRVLGHEILVQGQTMKAMAVKTTMKFTAMFSRDDDARLANELLMWTQGPIDIRLKSTIRWKNTTIELPSFFKIDKITYNDKSYNEVDWLEKNRIIPITFEVVLRTYVLGPNTQSGGQYAKEGENFKLTEESTLQFITGKNLSDDPEMLEDTVHSYFNPEVIIDFEGQEVWATDQTISSVKLNWSYTESVPDSVSSIKIVGNGIETIEITENILTTMSKEVLGLQSNSTYRFHIYFYLSNGQVTLRPINATTLYDPDNDTDKLGKLEDAVGFKF